MKKEISFIFSSPWWPLGSRREGGVRRGALKKALTSNARKLRNEVRFWNDDVQSPRPNPPHQGEGILTNQSAGQVGIEMTFSMIVIVMLLLSMVRVFFWVGNDLAARRQAHETSLMEVTPADPNFLDLDSNYRQLRPRFYESTPMNGVSINSDIFGTNRLQ